MGDREHLAKELLATQRSFHSAQLQISEMQAAGRPHADAVRADAAARDAPRDVARDGARAHRRARELARVEDDGADPHRRAPAEDRQRALPRVAQGRATIAAAVLDGAVGAAQRGPGRARAARARQGRRPRSASSRRMRRVTSSRRRSRRLRSRPRRCRSSSIVIPVYGKPHAHLSRASRACTRTRRTTCRDPDRRRRRARAGRGSARDGRPACASSATRSNLGFIGTCNRGAELARGEHARVPQQRHDRDAGLARGAAARCSTTHPDAGLGRRQAHLPGRPAAGGGRHRVARRLRVELRPRRRSGPARVQLPAAGRLLLGRLPRVPPDAVPRVGRLRRRATRPPTTRTPTSRSPCAPRGARSTTSRVHASCTSRARRRAPTRPRASSATRSSTSDAFAAKWAAGARAPSRQRRGPASIERDRWAKQRVLVIDACMLTPDHDAGSVRMLAILEILTVAPLQGDVRRRQPRAPAALRRRSCSSAASRCCSIRSCARSPIFSSKRGSEFDIVSSRATTSR